MNLVRSSVRLCVVEERHTVGGSRGSVEKMSREKFEKKTIYL